MGTGVYGLESLDRDSPGLTRESASPK